MIARFEDFELDTQQCRLTQNGEILRLENINTAVRKIRGALGDDPETPRFIETVVRLRIDHR